MEIFEVLYRGKIVNGIKTDSGEIYVDLQTRQGERGTEFRESISRNSNGWKFSSFAVDNPKYNLILLFRDDGKLACRNGVNNETFVTKEVFNPDLKNAGKLNKIATEIYPTIEQLNAYKKRDIPALTIAKLRKFKLVTTIKLLGFSSIKDIESDLDDTQCYFALSRIGEQLKNYINLGNYINLEGREKPEDVIRVNIPKEMTREEFIQLAKSVKEECSEDANFIQEKDDQIDQKRSILPDYYAEASKKMPYYDWIFYTNVVKETAKLILGLNADLLETKNRVGIQDLSKLATPEVKQRISQLINSKDFIRACDIENRFILRESETLVTEINSILGGSIEISGNSPMAKALDDVRREETVIIKERKQKIQEQGR